MKAHKPYMLLFADVTDKWVVRCDCGCKLYKEFADQKDAKKYRDQNTLK